MSRLPSRAELELWHAVMNGTHPLASPAAAAPPRRDGASLLDLHGRVVQDAYARCLSFVEAQFLDRRRSVEVVTGRSGQIRREFPKWMETAAFGRFVRDFSALNGGGSFRLDLFRRRS